VNKKRLFFSFFLAREILSEICGTMASPGKEGYGQGIRSRAALYAARAQGTTLAIFKQPTEVPVVCAVEMNFTMS
jgi:hypothetical protein